MVDFPASHVRFLSGRFSSKTRDTEASHWKQDVVVAWMLWVSPHPGFVNQPKIFLRADRYKWSDMGSPCK